MVYGFVLVCDGAYGDEPWAVIRRVYVRYVVLCVGHSEGMLSGVFWYRFVCGDEFGEPEEVVGEFPVSCGGGSPLKAELALGRDRRLRGACFGCDGFELERVAHNLCNRNDVSSSLRRQSGQLMY